MFRGVSKKLTVAGLLLVLIGLTGCARNITLHPITDSDYRLEVVDDKNWHCISDFYLEEIVKAKVKK